MTSGLSSPSDWCLKEKLLGPRRLTYLPSSCLFKLRARLQRMTLANLSPALASATGCALHSSNCTSQTRSAYPRSHTARNSPRLQCDHSAKWHACPASVSPHRSRRRTWCRAAAGDDSTADGSPEEALSQSTRSAMHSLSQQSRAGSDYGEVFILIAPNPALGLS